MTESVEIASEMPEIIFHRALIGSGSPYPRGKQNIDFLPEYKRQLFQDTYDLINVKFQQQGERLGRKLHFDFIDSDNSNALAFRAHDFAMVGATRGLVDHLVLFSGRLSGKSRFVIACGLENSAVLGSDKFAVLLFSLTLQFLASHELGHHLHGHVDFGAASGTPFFHEFIDATAAQNNIDLQAMEIDADAYAVALQLSNMFQEQKADIARGLGISVSEVPNRTILALFLATVICFLHSNPQTKYPGDSIHSLRHPPRVIRLNYIIGNIQRWCSENLPELGRWPEQKEFQNIAQIVVESSGVAAKGMSWSEEDRFIISELGKRHIKNLDTALTTVAELMKPYSWRRSRVESRQT